MLQIEFKLAGFKLACCSAFFAIGIHAAPAFAHGDVAPQAVDTKGLEPLGKEWKTTNPYKDNKQAIEIGKSGYAQNCARCHGLEAVSGGIAPDLRLMPPDAETDAYFAETVRKGRTRAGTVYMPPFEGTLSQEAIWAMRTWLNSIHTK